ncbi:MAG: aldehyde dehydrogenase family protein [Thermodesulfobacteriota bacterium]
MENISATPAKMLINGQWVETAESLEVKSPFDGSTVGAVFMAGKAELDEALASAKRAFKVLSATPAHERAALIRKVISGLRERSEELARTISAEAGKPITDARTEVARSINTFTIAAGEATRQGGEVVPLDITAASEGRFALVRRFPVGPVLGITPFNFPLNLVGHKVAPAMACGNSIIIKPASKTPLTALLLGRIITEAGWPAGGVNIVPSSGMDAGALAMNKGIKKISFTGSPGVGWALKKKASEKKVSLELGGNAGVIVCEDAPLDLAAKRCATGAFVYAGQVCISLQRIYVHKDIFGDFKERFLRECEALKPGDPADEATTLAPMIDESALTNTAARVEEAVSEGAELLTGGKRQDNFFLPTVLTKTTSAMKVCSEELFAPVVILEQYEDFKEAVAEVNSGDFGLQAGVFTDSMERLLYAYNNLEVGGVIAGDIPTFRTDNMPYGGVKESGFGREGVRYAIEEMTEPRLLALKNPVD